MIRNILTATGFVLVATMGYAPVQGQTYSQSALMFSQPQLMGSARFQGISGAGVALGGDISNGFNNPAGLGFSRKSEFSITPAFTYNNSNSLFDNSTRERFYYNTVGLNGLGITLAMPKDNTSGAFKGGAFSISFNKTNDFNSIRTYSGENYNSSIIDKIMYDADGVIYHSVLENEAQTGYFDLIGLAYNNYLLNPVSTICRNNSCTDQWNYEDRYSTVWFEPIRQSETIERKGGQGAVNFAYGANFADRLYIGATLTFHSLRYSEVKTYREEAIQNLYEFNNLVLVDSLRINGTGTSLSVGAIFRPSNLLRVGLSVTTPTVYQVRDAYRSSLATTFNADTLLSADFVAENDEVYAFIYDLPSRYHYAETEEITSSYSVTTPFRAQAGVSLFLGKAGFISGEVEYVGYGGLRLGNAEPANLPFDTENRYIKDNYQSSVNVRVGAEFRLKPLYVRGGVAYMGSPQQQLGSLTDAVFQASAGVGLRTKKFYTDFALVGRSNNTTYTPYDFQGSPQIDITQTKIRAVASVGFFF